MSRLYLACARHADAQSLAPRLRRADLDEIAAATGRPPEVELHAGIVASVGPQVVLTAGLPIAVFGVVDRGGGIGSPWLLGTDDILVHWREFARTSRAVLPRLREPWQRLENHVMAANTVHVRWLRWLGARLAPPAPWGRLGADFHHFTL